MKTNKFNILSGILSLLLIFTIGSCKDDDVVGNWNTQNVDALLIEAKSLIENSNEGINAGDQKPGSAAELQEVVTWVEWKLINSDNQGEVDDAANKLQIYIDNFKANIVALAIPWIKQTPDTHIQISDNIKPILNGAWTIEIECYIVDLNQRGYSNNLFSCEQSGPDSGFGVRYFGDGKIQAVVGNNNWIDTGDQAGAGTMKAGEWMHVALSNTGSHQVLYINGLEVATNDNMHLLAADKPFVIGNSPMWTDRVCNTMVKNLRIWNKVRTAQEILDNKNKEVTGEEAGLESYFPLQADLGAQFVDVKGNYTAKLVGDIEWRLDGQPPVIVLDYTAINASITEAETLKSDIVEGTNEGDYPVGTKEYLQKVIDDANDIKQNANRQDQLDEKADAVLETVDLVKVTLVADAMGVFIDREDPDAVGLRITPNYTPQGDYTVEFDVKVKSLHGYGTGEFFNNGNFGLWVYGYEELTEENVLASGGLWNFTNAGSGWQGPKAGALTIKSGEWQHVAIVHDDAARTTTLFVDGIQKGVQEDIGAPEVSGWGEIWLGNGWGKMNGYIKDFRLWDVARDQSDLNSNINGDETGLHIYLPLDKVAGIGFKDVTGNYNAELRGIKWNK